MSRSLGHSGKLRIGVDTGGTFTDLVVLRADGTVDIVKTPSTPPDFQDGIHNGLQNIDIDPRFVIQFYHGTTVTANAILTRSGAKTAFLTTMGFRDILSIRRGNREDLYDIQWDPPEPLVSRSNCFELRERIAFDGSIVTPLVEGDVRRVAEILRKRGIEAVAVSLMHSYANAVHERQVKEILREEIPGVYLSISSEVLPEPPEFERASTTTANAYVGPVLSRYMERIGSAIQGFASVGDIIIMHSGGGTMTPDNATRIPIRTVTSGPAAGVLAAAGIGRATGRSRLVSLDSGGTSADIATIQDGQPRMTVEQEIEWGLPIGFPAIDVVAIGAGGGSIAWIDDAGVPHSGPQSAGADPGPVAYGKGGTEPTNTDAQLVLGRLTERSLLGGQIPLDAGAAWSAIEQKVSRPLGLEVREAAAGVLRISNSNMANAIHQLTVQRGLDPREFTLVAFGGSGPMHAVEIARSLEMPEVIIPLYPGTTSALGLLFADARHDLMRPFLKAARDVAASEVRRTFEEMEAEALALLASEGFSPDESSLERFIELRYVGQVRALPILTDDALDDSGLLAIVDRFHKEYEEEFKYAVPDLEVEAKRLRVVAIGSVAQQSETATEPVDEAPISQGQRDVYFSPDGIARTEVFHRTDLHPGQRFSGPAVVEQLDSTAVIPPGAEVIIDEYRNLVVEV